MSTKISRRELLAGAGASAAALARAGGPGAAGRRPGRRLPHTTVVTVDAVQHDVALAVDGDTDRGHRS